MARFFIRRNHPYAGMVTLSKFPGGSFTPVEMRVAEADFIAATVAYLKGMPRSEKSKLQRAAPPEASQPPPPGNGDNKQFKVRKAETAVAG